MRSKIQRLYSVTGVISRAQRGFSSIQHRAHPEPKQWSKQHLRFTSSHNESEPSSLLDTPFEHQSPSQSEPLISIQKFEIRRELSKVHWALAPGYKVGGKIEEGLTTEEARKDGNYLTPHFNEKTIPLKIQSPFPRTIIDLPHIWLRDNCRCSKCVNQDTMQRALDTFSIPENIKPSKVTTEKEGLRVIWENDGHISTYPWDWLLRHRRDSEKIIPTMPAALLKPAKPLQTLWGGDQDVYRNPPSVSYDEIMADDKGVGKWTAKIREYGFCYVDGCPVSPGKTQELLERIAFIRPTHYGGFYDFTSDLTMKDTAYTSLALPAHTDTTYFTDPAGLQMFHMLSHTDGEGGSSLLVDGFKVATQLKVEDRAAYTILRATPIQWHASGNEGITITPSKKFPVLNVGPRHGRSDRSLLQIRWNNDDRGVVGLLEDQETRSGHLAESWYQAARKWDEILKRKEMQYWAQLEPGRPLIFDNWRVLHGRSAFTGKRRICGGYINHDDYISRWRNTNFTKEEVMAQIL